MMDTTTTSLPERPMYLVVLAMGPMIWAAHFFATYIAASLWCAPTPSGGPIPLAGVRMLIVGITIAALAGIALVAWSGYRRHSHGAEREPHDADSPEDRHRFLGFATLLLAGLSAVATIYVAISTFFFSTC